MEAAFLQSTQYVIGKQFSPVALGYVSQGKKYPSAIGSMLNGAIQPVMLSAVAHVQDDVARVKRLVRRALKTSTFMVIPAMSLFAMVAPVLVPLLLGNQWIDSVPFLQVYCIVYTMLPIHTTNLQALNGMGRSDWFLRLEIIKKIYGFAWILFAALVINDIYFMIGGYIISGIIGTIINSWPNKQVIGYSYFEQICDILPSVLLTVASCLAVWGLSLFSFPPLALLVVQIMSFVSVYLGLAAVLHVEEFTYLLNTVKDLLAQRQK